MPSQGRRRQVVASEVALALDRAGNGQEVLATAMRRGGFVAYDREWWHFTLRGEPYRDTYFNFVVK